ncbi:MAG: hypothetical protein ND895_14680 [Pyrinomonadaceae bacterium]|nr:hypothetical protein [Pyrinomonadaceae bacterium]
MNARNRFKPALALGAVVIGVIALAAVLTIPIGHAQRDPHPASNVLPPVGIAFGQTLRVTFLNVGNSPLEVIPCVFDGDGAHLKTGALIRLAPGKMRSFDLSRSEIGGRTESSVEVRAGVHADRPDLKHLVVAGEVIEDATGKSSLFVPGKRSQPEPDRHGRVTSTLASVGITGGQTARVTFLNVGSSPVELQPCWFDSNGAHLKEGATVTLAPGQMRSLELNWSEAVGGRTETRVQVRGAVHVRRRDAEHLVIAGEVIEDATGKSSLYVSPGTRRGFDPQPDPPALREQ